MEHGGYQGLRVWQKAVAMSEEVGLLCARLPKYEQFELAGQLRSAADSVSSNIAEGSGRKSDNDYIQFLHVARGSNNEVQTQLRLCVKHGYLEERDIRKVFNISISVNKLLWGLIKSLKAREEKRLAEEKERKIQAKLQKTKLKEAKLQRPNNQAEHSVEGCVEAYEN